MFSPPLGRGIKGVGLFIVNLQMIWLSTNQILRKMPRNVRRVLTPSLDEVPVRVGDQEKPCLRVIRYLSLRGTKQSKQFAHQQRERFT